ncbi:DUF7927 domain-containing protein [Okibacterium endophyticum]
MRPRKLPATVAIATLVAGLFTVGATVAFDEGTPASAATSPSQVFMTAVGPNTTTSGDTMNAQFGTSGVTASITATVSGTSTGFLGMPGSGGTITSAAGSTNVATYLEPDAPAASASVTQALSQGHTITQTITLDKPVLAPMLHVVNLDGSYVEVTGTTTTGDPITLTPVVKNNALEITGNRLNSTPAQSSAAGCQTNAGANPTAGCGSIRLGGTSGLIQSFTLTNVGSISGDSWAYTLSFPTLPLTKEFSPTQIPVGGTSQLTFSLTNPNDSAQPDMSQLSFADSLPTGVTLADGTVTDNGSCGTPAVTAPGGAALAAGGTEISAADVSVAVGATCTVTVNVTSDTVGSYTNDNDNLSSGVANLIPDADTTLEVVDGPVQCGPGGTLVPVDLIQNPSFESRTGNFSNSVANSINYATGWYDSHPTGGQYHVFSPTFDSGPAAAVMPIRAGAEGYGFMGGHSSTPDTGEGATNTLIAPLNPLSTYVGYFSMAAGGYSRQGNGYMQFYGVNDPAIGSVPTTTTVPPTAANSELLFTTPVVDFPGVGVTPQWEQIPFTLNAGQAWPYLRVEVRNETPANNATAAGQVWMNFDDFHLFECEFDVDLGDAPNSYGTDLASDGPRHNIVPGINLGTEIDGETDGQPNAAATGDDDNNVADEDGVTFNPSLSYPNPTIRTGTDPNSQQPISNTLELEASADGFASVWVDWNQDGDFLDAGEQVANAQAVTAGSNDVTFTQGTNPAGIESYVRVRYSTDAASIAAPTGAAPDGEVEDYRVLFERLVQPDTCTVSGTEYYAFTFAAPVDRQGNGGVGSTARYENVTVIDGVAVDMVVEVTAGTLSSTGFFFAGGDDPAWNVNANGTVRYSFYEAGTTTPVDINAVFTVNDMDGTPDTTDEVSTWDADDLAAYAITQGSRVVIAESGGSVTFTGHGLNNGDPVSRFQVVLEGKSTFEVKWQGSSNAGFSFDGDGDIGIQPPACQDFGDAPDTYGTDLGNNGPNHTIVPGLMIGSLIDFDPDGQPSPGADGDDTNRIDDEDAFTEPIILNPGVTEATLTVPVTNSTGAAATLYGWIDSNNNGRFEASEFTSVPVPVGATSVDLAFAGIPATTDGTSPAVRLRLTTDALADNAGTIGVDERSLGAATNGEVEDHLAQIATRVPISCVDPFVETFGAGTGYGPPLPAGQTTYQYRGSGVVNDGMYGLVSNLPGNAGSWWHTGGDHTPDDSDGRLMLINASYTEGIFFQRTFTQLVPGADYDFSAWITNANASNSPILPNVAFRVVDPATGTVLAQGETGDISNKSSLVWERHGLQFTATQSTVRLELANNGPGGTGNDLAIDDISFSPVCEFGDAPDSYGTLISNDGAGHIATGPTLGTERDTEANGQPNATADGDDTVGTPDDEDGVAAPIAISVGAEGAVTVRATNDTDEDVTLAGWIDLNGDGVFDTAERVVVTVPANSPAADYQLDFPVLATTADTYARFRIYGEVVADPQPTGTAAAGEVEDYLVTVLQPGLEIEKTSNATEDTRPGDDVTYTVTATNSGAGDYTAANPAVVLDDLSGVLDDGVYNNDAQASDGSTPSYASPLISWSGPLASGDVVTIEYTVTIAGGGDGVVRNVAFAPGCVPADPDCVTTTPECDPPTGGTDPTTGIPCAESELLLPKLTHTKVANTTELPVDGGEVEYTITVTNAGPGVFTDAKPGSISDDLSGVLDDGTVTGGPSADVGTATFDATGESIAWEGALGVGEVATITYTVTYDSSTGDNSLVNVACLPVELAQNPADPCRSVQIPGSDLQDRKSVNPASGTSVVAGQEVTYTLYFENTGQADATVDTFDDLSNVLDDAVLTGGPTTSDPALTATLNGNQIGITGTVPVNTIYTVTYTVTVNAFDQQGDHILGNVLGGDEGCPADDPTCRTENPIRHLTVTKTSDAAANVKAGDTVEYTVTVKNDGKGDYTDQEPAVARDDLTDVIDDATYNGDADASAGTVSYTAPILTWTGALASGDTETFTYTVTVTNAGDHVLENTAGPVCADPEICDPPVVVTTPLPHVVPAKSSAPASGEGVNAGDVVTYTLTWTNDGEAAGVVDATDDLSDVLDDGDVTAEPAVVPVNPAITVLRTGDQIRVTGPIGIGEVVTVTYEVTIRPDGERGNNVAKNVLTPDIPPYVCEDGDVDCEEFPPPVTEHPIGELEKSKTSNPASGTSVVAGQDVTYTLTFKNVGKAPVDVDTFDDLSGVLDDAALTGGPTRSDAVLTPTLNGTQIDIDGTIPLNGVVTVTYTVTVNEYAQQGDHVLGNVLGEDCAEDDDTCRTENPIRHLTVTKTSDAAANVKAGDTVEYTVTVKNDGKGDYTDQEPAVARDDLTDVIDDATYNGDADASAGTVSYTAPILTWTGALASGDTETFTYTVTVTNAGNHVLENTAGPVCADPEICDPPVVVTTPLPHVVPGKSSEPASGEELQAGDVVTYTLTWTNDGEAAGVVDATDDLSDILDDGTVSSEPVPSDPAVTVVRNGDEIRITGPIQKDQTITVTYQVTINPDGDRGNNIARNVLTPDVPPEVCADGDADCEEFPPPVTEHPLGELDDWKTVDPASGGTVRPGQEVTYTLHFQNTGKADVDVNRDDVLTKVLDDATITTMPASSDSALTVSALNGDRFTVTGTLIPGQVVTVTYTVTVNPDGARGDDRLGNVLVPNGEVPPEECVPTDEERPDCTVNHVSNVVPSKSANPASGAKVAQGEQVTYTLTFENVSTNPDAAPAPIDYTDHMAGVLDDATITSGPTSSDASVTVATEGDTIRVTGAVASGEKVTVTYTVTVKAYDRQGDHHLGNVIAVTGEEPICAPDTQLCTSHELTPPPPGLSVTGGDIAWAALVGALALLVLGGGAVMITRRRRETANAAGVDVDESDRML